jgi:lipoprotein-releasing system permease protein
MFEFFIARRYLRAKRKQVVISVITVISVIGVAAGVMALVIALAINTGFSGTLQRNLLGATGHVSIQEKEPGSGIEGWEQLSTRLATLPHVKSVMPGLYDTAYITGPVRSSGAEIKGISVKPGAPVPEALVRLKAGSMEGLQSGDSLPGIILGSRLADFIGAALNKQITLTIPRGALSPFFGASPSIVHMRVAGIFETGFYDEDMNWSYTSIQTAQKIFALDDVVNSIELRLDDVFKAPQVEREAEDVIGPKLGAITWEEQNRQILSALRAERIVTVITVGLIQIVAALNILITLVMMVMEKYRDIAILMSMGAKARQIRNIFVFEGILIGAVGTAIGLVLGYTLSYFADHYRWIKLDEQIYSLAFVPFETHWLDGVLIAAAAMTVSLIATLYPARSATRIAPVEALRYE